MYGLHSELGIKGTIFALVLELLFLGICVVFIGYGVSELKKHKAPVKNLILIILGFSLAGLSVYVTKLLIEG